MLIGDQDTIRSWIVAVFHDSDLILQMSDDGIRDRNKAMSIAELNRSIVTLSPEDDAPCELSSVGSTCRIDTPIVGAGLIDDKEVLLIYALDRWDE